VSNTVKLLAPSAAASWLGSGVVARPRPFAGDCPPVSLAGWRGELGATLSADLSYGAFPVTAVLGAPGSRVGQMTGNPRQMSTIRTTQRLHRQRFRYWSPPN
jgi:hypothetical protein